VLGADASSNQRVSAISLSSFASARAIPGVHRRDEIKPAAREPWRQHRNRHHLSPQTALLGVLGRDAARYAACAAEKTLIESAPHSVAIDMDHTNIKQTLDDNDPMRYLYTDMIQTLYQG
jgi:hypothetical protein